MWFRATCCLLKIILCAISVVKANCVQGGAATNCVRREKADKYSVATMTLFSGSILLPFCLTVSVER